MNKVYLPFPRRTISWLMSMCYNNQLTFRSMWCMKICSKGLWFICCSSSTPLPHTHTATHTQEHTHLYKTSSVSRWHWILPEVTSGTNIPLMCSDTSTSWTCRRSTVMVKTLQRPPYLCVLTSVLSPSWLFSFSSVFNKLLHCLGWGGDLEDLGDMSRSNTPDLMHMSG